MIEIVKVMIVEFQYIIARIVKFSDIFVNFI